MGILITAEAVKALREKTGISVMQCKRALEEAGGDSDKALALLGSHAIEAAQKKSNRTLSAGAVASYIHTTGQVGAIVLLLCETDFVSKNDDFRSLGRDIAMHAAAMKPGSIEELLTQPFIKDETKTIADLIASATQKFGERIGVGDLAVFSVR